MIGIVVSRADSASEHVGEHLLDLRDWERREDGSLPDGEGGGTYYRSGEFRLREFDDLHLYLEGVAGAFDDPDLVVFASRHSGETGPLLTAHHTGNAGPAEYGGHDGEFAAAAPNAATTALDRLAAHAPDGYEVGLECTHHGPSRVGSPSMFVEVGSDEPQWEDPEAARAVARAILDLEGVTPHREPERSGDAVGTDADGHDDRRRQLVGIGGGHYAPRFTRVARETDWAVGHVIADWGLDEMGDPEADRDVLRRAFEASDAEYALLEGEYPDVERIVEDLGYRVVGETWVRETEDVPLPLVDRLEAAVGSVEEGTRFGDPAREAPPEADFEVASLPSDLLDATQAIDPDATLAALRRHLLAYDTEEGGNRVGDLGAVPADAATDGALPAAAVDDLQAILEREYDEVRREDDAVVVAEDAFAPERAREAGVPEGPAFGRLSAGEAVEVDGRTVTPEEVTERRSEKLSMSDT